MKTLILDNLISEKELFFLYKQIIGNPHWKINAQSSEHRGFNYGPTLIVKKIELLPEHYAFFLLGQSIVFRIAELLKEKNIGIPTTMERMWFNCTYTGKKTQHWLHNDDDKNVESKSIVLFLTPIWQPDWRGSFYVDGEEFKFKPGSAVIFDSKEYHQGESPVSETYNWQRITCNILVKKYPYEHQ